LLNDYFFTCPPVSGRPTSICGSTRNWPLGRDLFSGCFCFCCHSGDGESRTPTDRGPQRPERCASASSATSPQVAIPRSEPLFYYQGFIAWTLLIVKKHKMGQRITKEVYFISPKYIHNLNKCNLLPFVHNRLSQRTLGLHKPISNVRKSIVNRVYSSFVIKSP